MRKKPDFDKDLKIGEKAEEWVKDALLLDSFALASKGKYHDMIDGQEKIEVKYDMVAARTGNFFFEVISNINVGNLGACLYSRADTLCLVLDTDVENKKEMLFIDMNKLRFLGIEEMVRNHKSIRQVYGNTACYGVLLRLEKIRRDAKKRIVTEVKL